MADSEVLKKLKDIPYRIQTASLKGRRDVVDEIQDVLSTPEITEPAVRFVCRVLTMTLHRYRDSKSQSYVRSLIFYLITNHYEWTLNSFLPLLLDISVTLKNTASTRSTCESGLFVLRWTTILTENSFKTAEEGIDYSPLILSQANLLTVNAASGNQKSIDKSYALVHNAWKKIGIEKVSLWLSVLASQAPDAGPHVAVGFSALCKHYKDIGKEEAITPYKGKMLDSFIKSLISVKARPNANYIRSCADLLQTLDKSEVKDTLLPALHKAMLRSPETITQAVGEVVANLEIDLENSIVDIGKNLIAGLNSKDEWVRTESQNALESVAIRVRSLEAAKAILDHAFAFYNGAGGKLTSPEDKISVLQGISSLSEIQLAEGAAQAELWAAASAQAARVLAAEGHERTLLHAARAVRRYSLRSRAPAFLPVLAKQLSCKTTPDSVRVAYVGLISETLRLHPTADMESLRPVLQAAVTKGLQNTGQINSVSEAVCALAAAGAVRARAAGAAGAGGAGAGAPRWEPAAHAALLHNKQLANMQPEVLTQVVWLCTSVLETDQNVVDDKDSPIYNALIYTLLSTTKSVRDSAIEDVRRVLASTKKSQIAKNLVAKLNEILEDNKFLTAKEKTPSDDKAATAEVTGKMIIDCVHALCSYREYPVEDRENLVIELLPACHHPLVVTSDKRAWVKIVKYLRLDPDKLVNLYAPTLRKIYIDGFVPNETMCGTVATLCACGGAALGGAVQRCIDALAAPALLRVTRDEYFTYLTPPGELYDKSGIPGNEDNQQMNMKRESKAYSYKEQLEELQLRREILEKQKREGKVKEVPLSAKQKEAMKAQLAKEEAIRERLTELERGVRCGCALVRAAAAGGGLAVRARARRLLPALLAALRSPLCAAQLVRLARDLRACLAPALPPHLAAVMIRLHNPQCDLEPSWTEEPLEAAVVRQVELLHSLTVGRDSPLSAPAFCYAWGLLERALEGGGLGAALPEPAALQALATLAAHAHVEQPELLPIDRMFTALYNCISSSTGRVQAAAAAALLEAARGAARAPLTPADVRCLLHALQADQEVVRDAALRALTLLAARLAALLEEAELAPLLTTRLYVATHDPCQENKELACALWAELPGLEARLEEAGALDALLAEVEQPSEALQRAGAAALAARAAPPLCAPVLRALQAAYMARLPLIPAKLDGFGHVVSEAVDEWAPRRGVALALAALAARLAPADVSPAMAFFVDTALADRSEPVRNAMLTAAMAVVDLHGKETLGSQLPVFENFLDKAPKSGGYDSVRQSVVLLVGSLARHLEPHDARVRPIALRLVQALSTPSQQVQEAVSNCLPHLVSSPALEQDIPGIVNKLLKQLLTADKYADRKGAAYGIAGIVKGLGILSLKQLDIMGKLTEAIQEKKNYKYREGALFGFEMLCHKLGRLFEPYVVHVLPHLLLCLGDGSQYVRAAADDAARLIMSRLSAHGVKLVLPALLHALHDDNWRTKAGSIELLGAMAYCAPKQLSSCLPSIVPRLIDVLSDSHVRVQAAGGDALRVIGSVIRNPEIQAIVGVLLAALQDPSANTSTCLHTLLDTKFVHFIDAASLALIMPVVQRAFLDRSTETRKMAAQIIGNMYSLTDQKDLAPYLPSIMPGLKSSLLDPVPEVRAVSARALGAMVRGMGEASFEELLPWLMHTLTCEASSVDRSGAAQGLSEVVAGLGVQKLHKIMPDIIATAERMDIAPHVKDGYIMMFIYMPGAFTDEFTPYIGQIIPPILQALADESEFVRDTALRAGQRIVNLYAESAIALLLPELERGLFADNWRIRYSSVQLLGDLLYRISGVSGKMSTETASDDDNFGTEQSHRAIISTLGVERRNRVLAGLYMGRSDVALMVRQAALHVWKVVVTNTPKTLREILPTLFGLLLGCLASESLDKRQVAARTLGDLVRKLGERVLPEIVPILERGLKSDRADQRQGVCIGLSEILASTSRDAVLSFADGLVPTVRTALCDPLPPVRAAAARTFDALHHAVGNKALDDILPPLLAALHDPDPERADYALDGLKQVMAIKSRAVLPYLVPVVCSGGDTRALSALAAAAGPALARHLPRVLPALLDALAATPAGRDHCRDALLPVTDPAGVRCIIDTLLDSWRTDTGARREAAAALLCAYVSHARCDIAPHVPQLLRGLMALLLARGDSLQPAWEALSALTKSLSAEQLLQHVSDMRHAVKLVAAELPPGELLPGFCLPKGIAPVLPLFREAILNGLPEDKEAAALLLGEVIRLTSAAALQPSVVHVTGPLIRILGDRFSCSVKAAVLDTLALLLAKVGVMLKQFLPQLQTTFLKALHDPHRGVRLRAGTALAQLVLIHTRADPLFSELCAALKTPADTRDTLLQALRLLLIAGGSKVSEPLSLSLLATLTGGPLDMGGAGALGALLPALREPHRAAALAHHVLAPSDDPALQDFRLAALTVALRTAPAELYTGALAERIDKAVVAAAGSERAALAAHGVRAAAFLLRHARRAPPPPVLTALARSMNHPSNEVKQVVGSACGLVVAAALADSEAPAQAQTDVLRALVPALVNGTKEKQPLVRAQAELALRAALGEAAAAARAHAALDAGAGGALADVMARLTRRAADAAPPADDDLDVTLVT